MASRAATREDGPATALDARGAHRLDEGGARALLERLRWPDGPACPHCGGADAARFRPGSSRPGLHKCRGCRRQFSVTIGTVLQGTRVPLRHWVAGFALACRSERGVSALELMDRLELGSYQTAWNMARRMRAVHGALGLVAAGARLSFAPRPLDDVLRCALRSAARVSPPPAAPPRAGQSSAA